MFVNLEVIIMLKKSMVKLASLGLLLLAFAAPGQAQAKAKTTTPKTTRNKYNLLTSTGWVAIVINSLVIYAILIEWHERKMHNIKKQESFFLLVYFNNMPLISTNSSSNLHTMIASLEHD